MVLPRSTEIWEGGGGDRERMGSALFVVWKEYLLRYFFFSFSLSHVPSNYKIEFHFSHFFLSEINANCVSSRKKKKKKKNKREKDSFQTQRRDLLACCNRVHGMVSPYITHFKMRLCVYYFLHTKRIIYPARKRSSHAIISALFSLYARRFAVYLLTISFFTFFFSIHVRTYE